MSTHRTPITEQAAALLAEAERSIADSDARLRAMGLDPTKVRALADSATAAQRREADEALHRDLADIDQAVAEEKARLTANGAPGAPSATTARKPRPFI